MTQDRLLFLIYLLIFTFFLISLGWVKKSHEGKNILRKLLLGIWSIFLIYIFYTLAIQWPLFSAIRKGEYEKVIKILDEKPQLINSKKLLGDSTLHVAVKKENMKLLKLLIERGADINAENINRVTPLHLAVKLNNIPIAELLLKNGANINEKGFRNGLTPLHLAVIDGNLEMVKFLIKFGAKIGEISKQGKTALDFAKERGYVQIEEFLKGIQGCSSDSRIIQSLHPEASTLAFQYGAVAKGRKIDDVVD